MGAIALQLMIWLIAVWIYDFESKWWLCSLILIPAACFYLFSEEDQISGNANFSGGQKQSGFLGFKLVPKMAQVLMISALTLMIMSLARPSEQMVPVDVSKEGIDIVLALDVSISMLAKDFEPNRLEASKRVAKEFVKDRKNDRIGVVIYAAESFPRVPLTSDNVMVMNAIDQIDNGKLRNGTAIGMGLASAVNRLKESDSKSKAVILLSDGENNAGDISPLKASELAKVYGITVYTIGVGSEGTALSPAQDMFGRLIYREQPVQIDEKTLYEIAVNTGGKYFRAVNEEKLRDIYKEIDKLEKTRFESSIVKQNVDVYWKFLLTAFTLLSLAFLIKYVLFKSVFS